MSETRADVVRAVAEAIYDGLVDMKEADHLLVTEQVHDNGAVQLVFWPAMLERKQATDECEEPRP